MKFPELILDENILSKLDKPTDNPAPTSPEDQTSVLAKPRELRVDDQGQLYLARVAYGRVKWFRPIESPNMISTKPVSEEVKEVKPAVKKPVKKPAGVAAK